MKSDDKVLNVKTGKVGKINRIINEKAFVVYEKGNKWTDLKNLVKL